MLKRVWSISSNYMVCHLTKCGPTEHGPLSLSVDRLSLSVVWLNLSVVQLSLGVVWPSMVWLSVDRPSVDRPCLSVDCWPTEHGPTKCWLTEHASRTSHLWRCQHRKLISAFIHASTCPSECWMLTAWDSLCQRSETPSVTKCWQGLDILDGSTSVCRRECLRCWGNSEGGTSLV